MNTSPSLADIHIRTELRPGDLGYVAFLHGELYSREYGFSLQFEGYVLTSLNEFLHQYDPLTSRVWICEHQQKIIGFLALMNRGDSAQLRYFIIDPNYRGIGLGKELMKRFMTFYQEAGYTSCYLLTTDELHSAASLYKRYGFKLVEEKHSSAFGKPLIEQKYELR